MGQINEGLMRLILLCMAAAVAEHLMPEGAPRRIGRMACALVLLCALFSPVGEPDLDAFPSGQLWPGNGEQVRQLERQQAQAAKNIIEQVYAAYILDKASRLGCSCQVESIELFLQDGLLLPVRVELGGDLLPEQEQQLCRLLAEELGLKEENIGITKEGGP